MIGSLLAPSAGAVGNAVTHATPVSAVPSAITPNITNGVVYAITQVGSQIVVGGSFTGVQNHGSTTTLTRTYLLAFDATTGAVSTTFAPTLDGTVRMVTPGPSANTVYVGGLFKTVNGVTSRSVTLLDTTTGAIVSGFKPPAFNGVVYTGVRLGSRLLLGGTFTTAGAVSRPGLASLNATTGTLDSYLAVATLGHHNYNGSSGANGAVGPRALTVNPAGTRAMVIGNFKTADGLPRDQIVMLDLGATSATVDTNWATLQYTAACFSGAFDTYMTDVQYAADGSYFVVTATGGSGTNSDGTNSLCDTAARWESGASGATVMPTWVDYTGQDTLWSVAITGSAVYVGGHQRWLNNTNGHDNPGPGAVPRAGLAALDPISGVPLKWNPGRNPRGAGAYALLVTSAGLYVGSDTDFVGNYAYKRQKIAFFPLANGVATASTATATLPANVYEAGQLPNSSNTNVLYRVDAGGPTVGAADNGPDWMADQSDSDPGAQYRNSGSNSAGWSCCATLSNSVPASTPAAIFNSERWDPGSAGDGNEMQWSFPVTAGTHVGVRLYFANRYPGTGQPGQRVFDVSVDGNTVLPNYDIAAEVGDQTATMHEFDVTSPGAITVGLAHNVENPLINGIELINLDRSPGSGGSVDDLAYRAKSGSQTGPLTVVPNTGVAWGSTRGAFMVGNAIFYGATDGNFYRATFNGNTVGTPVAVDPYNDPAWSSVNTGSGQTYQGTRSDFYGEISSVTGAFYSNGRLYYALTGQSALYSRWFSPDSGIIGAQEFSTTGASFSDVAGMFASGQTIYYASRSDGSLHSLAFSGATPDGTTDTVVDSANDWRARGLFAYGSPSFPNQPPTASATSSCTGLTCSFDGKGSTDPDGTVASYAWNFGDSTTGTGVSPVHGYAKAGTYTVSLVVTDDRGAQSQPFQTSVTVTAPAAAVSFVASARSNGTSATPSVTVPGGVNAGDTEFLFVTTGAVNVTTSSPTGLTGWTQIARRTNTSMETTVFQRVAAVGDSGTKVTVPLAASAATDLSFVDYAGVTGGPPTLSTAADSSVSNHVTPNVNVTAGGSWVLSYWSDKNSSTSAWTLPAGVLGRSVGVGAGGGHIDGAIADSGQSVSGGSYGGLSATTGVVSGKGIMMSLVLAPGSAV